MGAPFFFFCVLLVVVLVFWGICAEWPFRKKRRGRWGVGVPHIQWGDIEEGGRVQRAKWRDIKLEVRLRRQFPASYSWKIEWPTDFDVTGVGHIPGKSIYEALLDGKGAISICGETMYLLVAQDSCEYHFAREWKARQYDAAQKHEGSK